VPQRRVSASKADGSDDGTVVTTALERRRVEAVVADLDAALSGRVAEPAVGAVAVPSKHGVVPPFGALTDGAVPHGLSRRDVELAGCEPRPESVHAERHTTLPTTSSSSRKRPRITSG
jgi:hypothetical protein